MKKRQLAKTKSSLGASFKDIILGGQDGLVNVLGVVLAVAAATNQSKTVIIAGVAANIAESLSMAAVAYTSTKAYNQYYAAQLAQEHHEVEQDPRQERKEVYDIYHQKGFRGKLLRKIVDKITSSKPLWIDTMMRDELKLSAEQLGNPISSAGIVGFSALVGSTIPLLPFFILPIGNAVVASIIISTMVLFLTGVAKARFTIGNWWKNGIELAVIGMITALAGYGVGLLLNRLL